MKWRLILPSFAILLFFCVSAYCLNYAGISSRVYKKVYNISDDGVPVAIVMNAADLYERWKRKGFRGRIVINIGKYLCFVEVEKSAFYGLTEKGIVNAIDIKEEYRRHLDYKNLLWLAMEEDMAREVYHVLPRSTFKEKLDTRGKTIKGFSEKEIVISELGSRRTMTDRLPLISEPVLLNIDASYFDYSDAEGFVRELKKSGLKTDLVTFNLSADNQDVTDEERGRAMEAARMFLVR